MRKISLLLCIIPFASWAASSPPSGVTQDQITSQINAATAGLGTVKSINGCTATCTVTPGNFVGSYTIATAPTCGSANVPYGSVAYITDLGGGPNTVKCLNFTAQGFGAAWTHFTYGIPGTISSTSGTVAITPLASPPITQLTGIVPALTTLTLQLQTTNLYPGYDFYIIAPPSLLGSILMTVQGVSGLNLSVLAGSTHHYSWTGTTLVTLQ